MTALLEGLGWVAMGVSGALLVWFVADDRQRGRAMMRAGDGMAWLAGWLLSLGGRLYQAGAEALDRAEQRDALRRF